MKTPKRDYFANAANAYDMFNTPGTSNKLSARWKRKNRVAQLKRTLERYKNCTNLPTGGHEEHAYKLLQKLQKPGENAAPHKWNFYTQRLLDIQAHVMQAIAQASSEAGASMERLAQSKRDAQKLFQEKLEEHMRKENQQ